VPAQRTAPLHLVIPAVVVAACVLLPLLYLVARAAGAGPEPWLVVLRQRTLQVLARTVVLGAVVTGASAAISLPLAWLVTRTDLPFRRSFSVLSALPLAVPSYVAGSVVVSALGPRGMLQNMLERLFGVSRLPEIYGFPGAALTIVLVSYPLLFLNLQASLKRMSPSLEEASRSLGRGAWRTFLGVVLPELRPAIASGALLVALYALSDFGAVSLLRYETFTWSIYLQYQTAFDRSAAAVYCLILVALALVILLLEARTRGDAPLQAGAPPGIGRQPPVVRLGRWRWPAFLFCASVVLVSLAMPAGVLLYWLVRGMLRGETVSLPVAGALGSVYASSLAAAVVLLLALPVALYTARYPGKVSTILGQAAYLGYSLPGITVALALVFFGVRAVPWAYQSMGFLVFAYLIRFLPQAVGACRASLLRINPHLEEAARSLGQPPRRVLATVLLPLMRQGLLAGAALVFFSTMKELPVTLILSPVGFRTLATAVWSASSEAFFARAAAPSLLLILVSAVPLALFTLRRAHGS
jgi:iron(III) transport system permease protein